ncbi:MAG: TerB family tellurite resistance protein [Chryseolinea sp.]
MLDITKLEHFRNLISLSAADGDIQEVERIALSKIAYAHEIPLERLNIMLSKANEYIYLIPQNTEDREKQLEDMIQLAWVDGTFAPAEKELIRIVGEKLGFSAPEVDRYIEMQKAS